MSGTFSQDLRYAVRMLAKTPGLTRVMQSLLYDVSPPARTFTISAVLFLTVAVVASYIPARRAARPNPSEIVR